MNYISSTHRSISDRFNDERIIENPEKYFGPNYKTLLNYWIYKENIIVEHSRLDSDIFTYALKVVNYDIANWCNNTSREIIASHIILDAGRTLKFIPLLEKL
jgi:hypothetical protein